MSLGASHQLDECIGNSGTLPLLGSEPKSSHARCRLKSAEIVRAVIGLGRALIAEGVETEGERSFLMLKGCEELQGYLIGRPAPAATYAMLINGDRANVLMAG